MSKRTDPHRPGAIIPAHYTCEVDFSAPTTFHGHIIPGFRWDCVMDRGYYEGGYDSRDTSDAALIGREKWVPGTHGTHERGLCCIKRYLEVNRAARHGLACKCDVCGAVFKSGSAFRYAPTGEVVVMGHDCAAKYEILFDASEAELHRDRAERALAKVVQREQNDKERAAFLAANPGLAEALEIEHHIIRDIKARFIQWRSISEKQAALVMRIAAEAKAKTARVELEASGELVGCAPPPAVDVPASVTTDKRPTLEVEIAMTRVDETPYGNTLKALYLVRTPEGMWKAWGTVPAGLTKPEEGWKGLRFTISATVERSQRDPSFAFFKRPMVVTAKVPETKTAKALRKTDERRRYPSREDMGFRHKARSWFLGYRGGFQGRA